MNFLLRISSYLFHPLWMPFAGTLLYFLISPRFFPFELIKTKLIAIAIMTIFIPMVFFLMLKTLRKASSVFLENVNERKWPLLFSAAVDVVILKYVLNRFDYFELYHFFLAIMIATIMAALLAFLKIKISLHMLGLAGLAGFLVCLSLFFNLDLVYTISFFIAVIGLTATSRLHYKAHSYLELLLGFLVGAIPQLVMLKIWLH